MRKILLLAVAGLALIATGSAAAHPLGNFTVNHYAAIEASGNRLFVKQVLDLAEIPTFQEGDRVRAANFGRELAPNLQLEVDGRPTALRLLDSRVAARPGAGGLQILRFEAVYEAAQAGSRIRFRDVSFGRRIGWREVVVLASRGAQVEHSSVPARSVSRELLAYPKDLLTDPLDVRRASATITLGSGAGVAPTLGSTSARQRATGGFESLISRGDLGLGVILFSLLVAAFWGAAHALTPGHGKAIVAGYLVGSRGRPRHAVYLGLIVTVTHTIGVFVLGIVTLMLSQFIVPERLYPWLTLTSGLLVVVVGASVLWSRVRHRSAHANGHDHTHGHSHDQSYGRGGLLGVGVAAGLLPCPSALVVLLSAIALHRIGLGLALIVAFSFGLAATITGIGLVAVLARKAFRRARLDGPLVHALPAVSALVILAVGVGITLKALPGVL